jgi:NTE family protein
MARIGLVLGAGGVVGHAFHAGLLTALGEETGWDPRTADIIVGTSAGSGVAAMLRAGMPAPDLHARATDASLSPEGAAVAARAGVPSGPLPVPRSGFDFTAGMAAPGRLLDAARRPWAARFGTVAAAVLPEGQVPSELVAAPLRPLFGDTWPDASMWICAVDLDRGKRVVFGCAGAPAATVPDAVAASCAIPGFFQPVNIGGARYVDGGAHSPTNLDVLVGQPLDLVIVSSPMSVSRGAPRPAPDLAARRLFRLYLSREAAAVRRAGIPVVTFQPSTADRAVMGYNAMDSTRRGPVAEQVRDTARRRLRERDLLRNLEALSRP